ncbi:MAG: proton-translocating transhydrogenase family protein [Holosporaceae bacterium]|nr:proton-translocating transhydrogenase family protein [Holosporaceae bacterium]
MKCGFQSLIDSFFWNLGAGGQASVSGGMHTVTVFILACFIGYYLVWNVTPALHAPLISVTNAISSVIIVGAIFAAAQHFYGHARIFGFVAIVLTAINIFGGFTITHRMLNMFRRNK